MWSARSRSRFVALKPAVSCCISFRWPDPGISTPVSRPSKVDLPLPEGPFTNRCSPRSRLNDAQSSRGAVAPGQLNCRFSISIRGWFNAEELGRVALLKSDYRIFRFDITPELTGRCQCLHLTCTHHCRRESSTGQYSDGRCCCSSDYLRSQNIRWALQ